MTENEKQN